VLPEGLLATILVLLFTVLWAVCVRRRHGRCSNAWLIALLLLGTLTVALCAAIAAAVVAAVAAVLPESSWRRCCSLLLFAD
jgi:RsiW-degrading membrane proteinase PrsW (M82 family)